MKFDLAALTRRISNPRRSVVPIRPINPPAIRATDLYRSVYFPVIAIWRNRIPALVDEYERTLAAMTTDSPAALRVELQQAEDDADAMVITVEPRLERWAAIFANWHAARWRRNVLSATRVDLLTMIGPEDTRETVQAVIQRNVGLVKSVSDQARERMADSVFRGLNNRTPSRQVAKELRTAVEMGTRRARNIASDQLTKISSALDEERRRQAGIDSWEWIHSEKANPRPEHAARNGFLYSDDPADVGTEYQGKKVRRPPDDRPGQLPFCGCTSRAVLLL